IAVAWWFSNQEVHDWFGRHLYHLKALDARWYVKADQLQRAGRDWQRITLDLYALNKAAAIIQDIEANPALTTREAKEAAFLELMKGKRGASHASYFRLLEKLAARGQL